LITENEIWPNFFIVGAPKAGTTSLYEYLNKVPSVYMSPVKEPFYFLPSSSLIPAGIRIRDRKKYLDLFRDAAGYTAIGEASPAYLLDPESPQLIRSAVPNAKIIIMLRHPVERAFSHYLMNLHFGESLSFIDALKWEIANPSSKFLVGGFGRRYIAQGLYSANVKRYFDTFGEENVKVLIFEEFMQDTKRALYEVLKFLNVDFQSIPDTVQEVHNPYLAVRSRPLAKFLGYVYNAGQKHSTVSRALQTIKEPLRGPVNSLILKSYPKPKITAEERAFLENIFYDDVQKLSTVLGRPLPWSVLKQ
jgi:hypothetical protein